MENKRTAVDYLKEKFITIHWFLVRDEISRAQADEMLKKSFEQAKEMEKNQMINFALHLHNVDMSKTGTDILMDEAEQYYKITYGK